MDRLVIRAEQIEALARPGLERFVRVAVEHVRTHFAALAASLGEPEVERGVRHALARARHHGFETERDLLGFVTLAFVFGKDFDTDPEHPWAAEILASREPAPIRMERLRTAGLRNEARARGYAPTGEGG
jgi:hypothetical protein